MFPKNQNLQESVILSEGQSPKSKDLRTDLTTARFTVRRSFDSLRSLRMTAGQKHGDPVQGGVFS